LCKLILHPTSKFLFYGIFNNKTKSFENIKKIHWEEEDKSLVLSREFKDEDSFESTHCFGFGASVKIVPDSFDSKGELIDFAKSSTAKRERKIENGKSLVFTMPEELEAMFNKQFPGIQYHTNDEMSFKKKKGENNEVFCQWSENRVRVTLFQNGDCNFFNEFTTPASSDVLYFVLSVLKSYNIEEVSSCSIYLLCEDEEEELKNLFEEYFENVTPGSDLVFDSVFGLELEDKRDFFTLLSASECV
jgi:hypothetical protein